MKNMFCYGCDNSFTFTVVDKIVVILPLKKEKLTMVTEIT